MDTNGWKKRLQQCFDTDSKVKILFLYPACRKPIIRRGKILSVDDKSFDIHDIRDGRLTFSYDFITEIADWEDE